jgi:hypothetical protein
MSRNKSRKMAAAQYIGAALIVFAFGLFLGHALNYQDIIANIVSNEADSVHVVHNSSKMAEHGARIAFYNLGTTKTESYEINFDENPYHSVNRFYTIGGTFTNKTDRHFTTIELNFSLLDENNNKIGDAYARCDGLNPGQTWSFEAENTTILKLDEQDRAVTAVLDDVIYTVL